MVQLPNKDKCDTEQLIEYRFDGITFHSIGYMPEYNLISFGSSKGKIYSYYIPVGPQECYDEEDDMGNKDIVNDKDVIDTDDAVVFKKNF